MQPHRDVGQVATDDEEQRGVEKGKVPGERGDLKARQTRHKASQPQFKPPVRVMALP